MFPFFPIIKTNNLSIYDFIAVPVYYAMSGRALSLKAKQSASDETYLILWLNPTTIIFLSIVNVFTVIL